ADALLRPDNEVPRTYEAKIRGQLSPSARRRIVEGVPLDGRRCRPVVVERMRGHRSKHDWLRLTLFEGRNRHIHRIFEAVGRSVTRLRRVSFAGVSVEGLPIGRWRPVTVKELQVLEGFAKGR
ncbi:MAG: pseudouridine synthase, partial [Proteobacteria bacterium]